MGARFEINTKVLRDRVATEHLPSVEMKDTILALCHEIDRLRDRVEPLGQQVTPEMIAAGDAAARQFGASGIPLEMTEAIIRAALGCRPNEAGTAPRHGDDPGSRGSHLTEIEWMILQASQVEHKPAWVSELAQEIATALRPVHGREAVEAIRQVAGKAEDDGPEAGFWVGNAADVIAEAFGVPEHD